MKAHFEQFAAYNRWANARVYEAALALDEADYRRNVGAFFKSLHGTLNHLLLTDRHWLKRLTGEGETYDRLDAILYEGRRELAQARIAEDERIVRYIGSLEPGDFERPLAYANSSEKPSSRSGGTSSPICSTTRPIIAGTRTPSCRSSPDASRPRSTCLRCSGEQQHRICGRWRHAGDRN